MALPLTLLAWQVAVERQRQSGWRMVCASSGAEPERLPAGGELVYGPPGAHVETDER